MGMIRPSSLSVFLKAFIAKMIDDRCSFSFLEDIPFLRNRSDSPVTNEVELMCTPKPLTIGLVIVASFRGVNRDRRIRFGSLRDDSVRPDVGYNAAAGAARS